MNAIASVADRNSQREVLLAIEHLCKIYGGDEARAAKLALEGKGRAEILDECESFVAVADATLNVHRGEIFVIMGLSGSGKSTLLRCINRLIRPTSGTVRFGAEDLTSVSEERLRELRLSKISMVFQHFALLPHKSVIDNVCFGLKLRGVEKSERYAIAKELLGQVGLAGWESRFPHNLSGGMKQRVGLARSLAVNPDILLMDEAFSALDPVIRREMQIELLRLQKELNKTILFITHDIQEALLLGDRIAMMKDGRVVQCGSPSDLILTPADDFVAEFTRDADRARMLMARDIMLPIERFNQSEDQSSLFSIDMDPTGSISILERDCSTRETRKLSVDRSRFARDTDRLGQLLPLADSPLPILVTDASGRVVGATTREKLLATISIKH
ncbi:putative glycine betaine/proline ABC transporter, ATP-binding protein [Kaistia sp. 32K]|uniref:quaternary amine ABC transporter ATP-binding protein n=1 Tax=Kaistia sp. 32K TaxID=2795690 RepID=UPI0019164DF2|nr:betaine/proline/choline family ABC transporter ATP-binding protein [Kaistia sp. 32K]BCP54011.1 putative glycine betaine/proline ABC transporter, ATP-binding protein [Kaistia sp. 32K]